MYYKILYLLLLYYTVCNLPKFHISPLLARLRVHAIAGRDSARRIDDVKVYLLRGDPSVSSLLVQHSTKKDSVKKNDGKNWQKNSVQRLQLLDHVVLVLVCIVLQVRTASIKHSRIAEEPSND